MATPSEDLKVHDHTCRTGARTPRSLRRDLKRPPNTPRSLGRDLKAVHRHSTEYLPRPPNPSRVLHGVPAATPKPLTSTPRSTCRDLQTPHGYSTEYLPRPPNPSQVLPGVPTATHKPLTGTPQSTCRDLQALQGYSEEYLPRPPSPSRVLRGVPASTSKPFKGTPRSTCFDLQALQGYSEEYLLRPQTPHGYSEEYLPRPQTPHGYSEEYLPRPPNHSRVLRGVSTATPNPSRVLLEPTKRGTERCLKCGRSKRCAFGGFPRKEGHAARGFSLGLVFLSPPARAVSPSLRGLSAPACEGRLRMMSPRLQPRATRSRNVCPVLWGRLVRTPVQPPTPLSCQRREGGAQETASWRREAPTPGSG
jgi:hypothetical protein